MKKSLLLSAALLFSAGIFADDVVLTPTSANVWKEDFGTIEVKDGAVVVNCTSDGWNGGGFTFDVTSVEGYNQLVIEYSADATFQAWAQGGPGDSDYNNMTPTIQLPFWKTSQAFDITGAGPIKQVCVQAIGQKFAATITKVYLRNFAHEYEEAQDIIEKVTGEGFSLSEFGAQLDDADYIELFGTCKTEAAGWGIGAIGAGKENYLNINASSATEFSLKVTGAELKTLQAYVQNISTDNYIYFAWWADAKITSAKLYKVKSAEGGQTTPTPVVNINVDTDVVSTVYYTLTGAQVDEPQKGINIVKQTLTDGSTRVVKVLVK
ncbi:MAG: hypothetical protein IKR17_03820 [Bacteroidales bacterium]|nr:hypothetical protein [Bacteroidales bacterium]